MAEFPRRRIRLFLFAGAVALGAMFLLVRPAPVKPRAVAAAIDERARARAEDGAAHVPAAPTGASLPAEAQGALFSFVQPSSQEIARLEAALPAPTRALRYVRVNTALVTGKASPFWRPAGEGQVVLPLADGGSLAVVIDGSEMLGADRFTSTGHLAGRPQSRAVFAFNAGFLHATIDDGVLGSHVLRVATAELSQFYQVDPALVPPCGGQRRTVVDGEAFAAAAAQRARAAATAGVGDGSGVLPLTAAGNPQRVEVHVMMAVTQDVLATLAGAARTAALQSAFDAVIVRVNGDLAASLVTARVKLVKVAETTYDETASAGNKVQDEALTALQSLTDGKMDELHALRDECGADIVCLALNRADFASSGLAFVIDTPGDTTNALFAFSVIQYSLVAGTRYVSHELGHSFGCAHDRENAFTPGAHSYSYGYRFFGADGLRYRDIMAYPPGIELGYFSNPDVVAPVPVNMPLGIAAGRVGESDSARTIEQAAFEVSGYRLQTQTAPGAGTLINVATLATAGPGERSVIAGFTVEGSQAKPMLLRAAGPALAALGVRDALAAPVLELYSGAARLGVSVNWSAQANAAAISAAAAQAGAFAFAPGSADAALLGTLSPGNYTAIVRSAVATGTVLVEAYESSPTSDRLVNVSTRAYADNRGHPLVAGFVVRGAPGATKRVLVRVLGPSLARAPFNVPGAMNDPLMEIRGAAGELLLLGDDWSTGAAGGASLANDFTPLVRYYNEKQIAATGLAPANRREPCLMADLPPGNYTVTVMPFENLAAAVPEVAQPGVALVEVFEIRAP